MNIPIYVSDAVPEATAFLMPPLSEEDLLRAGIDDEPLITHLKIETERSEGKITYKLTALLNENKLNAITQIMANRSVSLSIPVIHEEKNDLGIPTD
jgi:hypothetical protein